MVKSQTQQQKTEGYSVADERLDDSLILHCWNGVQDQIKRVVDFNRSQGIPNPEQWLGYGYAPDTSEPSSVKQKLRWLKIVEHKRTGEFLTLDQLVASGTVSEIEKEVFGSQKFPRIELLSCSRLKTQDGPEYLVRQMRAIGLTEIGAVVTLPLPDVDYTRKLPVSPTTAQLPDGNNVKVLQVGTSEFYYESSPRIWTTPFTKDNVLAALEKYPPSEELHGRISYTFEKEGIPDSGIGISSLEEFLTDDFDSTFERIRAPAPQIDINSKDLANCFIGIVIVVWPYFSCC